jgi:hypothetical protein
MLSTAATDAEVRMALPGDDLVPDAITQMDRAATFPAPVDTPWPCFDKLTIFGLFAGLRERVTA